MACDVYGTHVALPLARANCAGSAIAADLRWFSRPKLPLAFEKTAIVISLFSVPKPFRNHIGTIQANALHSWLKLDPACEIILFGAEDGTAETAKRFGAVHIPDVSRNEFGTPLLNNVFAKAQAIAAHRVICYVNADMILMGDFITSIKLLERLTERFLMVGRRWNVNLNEPFDFRRDDWNDSLRLYAQQYGQLGSPYYIDYFVFPKALFTNIPPFAIGRPPFDNWLLWKARSVGASLVDASEVVMAVHQNHDYAHHPDGRVGVYGGPEAKRNKQLMGGSHRFFTLADATHRLTPLGLRRNLSAAYFRRKWKFLRRALRHNFHRLSDRGSTETETH